jgi:hypothetical protein
MTDISSFLPINKEREEEIISYFYKNQKEVFRVEEKYFFDITCKLLYWCIKEISTTEYICDIHLLYDYAKKKKVNIDKKEIERIVNTEITHKNIDLLFTSIKDFYIENEILKKVETIASKTLNKKELDREGIKELSIILSKDISSLGDNAGLFNTQEIADKYRAEQEKRESGIKIRSLGYKEIDQFVTRPAAEEEMTVLVGLKGMGKSIFKLCQINNLLNQGICVVAFEPEMPMMSNIDRWISVRSGVSTYELLKKDKDQKLKNRIEKELRRIESLPNFIYYEDASLNIYKILDLTHKAKQIFRDRGVLPNDEYIFESFDTFDMLEDFEDADPKKIKANINKFHRLVVRPEKIHAYLLWQGNENKLRSGKMFKNPDDLDYYRIGVEDIEGGAAIASKARLVMSLNRPVQMKKMLFSERMEEWNMERDLLNIAGVKQNDGNLFFTQFSFGDNMRIYPYRGNDHGNGNDN